MNLALDWQPLPKTQTRTLEARDVYLSYGGRRVLQAVNLVARPGRLLSLIGPNGAGKSSLLSVMAGLCRPSLGEMLLDGQSLAGWPAHDLARRRAMLSQKVRLGFAFRVEEVVMLGRSPHGGTPQDSDRRIVEAALHATNARHLAGRNYLELSGGEQQRVQLARVLAQVWECGSEPGWLLLDEPEAGLDVAHQHEMLRHAKGMAGQGYGVIVVLHDLNLAARYADDVALLAQGRLICYGHPSHALDTSMLSRVYGMALRRTATQDGHWLIHPA